MEEDKKNKNTDQVDQNSSEDNDSDAMYRDLDEEVSQSIYDVEVESQDGFGGDYSRKRQKSYDSITSKRDTERYERHERDFYANASEEDFEKRHNKWRFASLMVATLQSKIRNFHGKTAALMHQSKNSSVGDANLFTKEQLTNGVSFSRKKLEKPVDLPDVRHVDVEDIKLAGKSHDHGRER